MSKEKQIDQKQVVQMARDICVKRDKPQNCKDCDTMWRKAHLHAFRAYKAGYRKQSEGEWISVKKPPDDYRDEYGELIPFLVCCHGTKYPFRAMYDGKNWGDGIGILKVTHWMPLPEPPKGE